MIDDLVVSSTKEGRVIASPARALEASCSTLDAAYMQLGVPGFSIAIKPTTRKKFAHQPAD